MKRIRLLMAAFAVVLGLSGVVPAMAAADTPQGTVCTTLGSNDKCSTTPSDSVSINDTIKAVISVLSFVIGVLAVIMIMFGGFRYVTAAGDSSKLTSAKNTLIYAIVGLVIAALAQAIVKFVLDKL